MTNTPTAPLDADVILLPCPFCGATDRLLVTGFTNAGSCCFWSVECLSCGVEVADDESQSRAAEHWNTRLASTQGSQGREAEAISTASEGDGLDRLYPEAYHLMLNFYCDRDFYNSDPSCRPADNVLMAIQYTLWSRSPKVASDTATGVREALDAARDYVADAASGALTYADSGDGFIAMAKEDLVQLDAVIAALSASPSDGAGS
jgi:Lar family restriction alleviation protein